MSAMNNSHNILTFNNDFRLLWKRCIKGKYIIGASAIVCVVIASIYLLWRTPRYDIKASVTLYEDTKSPANLMKQFSIDNLLGGSGSVYNEMELLGSHTTMMEVVKNLNLNTEYYIKEGLLRNVLVYPEPPLRLLPIGNIADTLTKSIIFKVDRKYGEKVSVKAKVGWRTIGNAQGTLPLEVKTSYGNFVLESTASDTLIGPLQEKIYFRSYSKEAELLLDKIEFTIPVKLADVIQIDYRGKNRLMSLDMIEGIIDAYNRRGIADAQAKKQQELNFIDERLMLLTGELQQQQKSMQTFKEANRFTDGSSEIQYALLRKGEVEAAILMESSKNDIYRQILAQLQDGDKKYTPISAAIPEGDITAIKNYNDLLIRRANLMQSAKPGNRSLLMLDEQLSMLRHDIYLSVEQLVSNSDLVLKEQKMELQALDRQLNSMPKSENVFREIYRDQAVKEQLYTYLIEQHEELAMSIASASERAKIINKPYVSTLDEQKSAFFIILLSFIIGLLIFPFIWYIGILNNSENKR